MIPNIDPATPSVAAGAGGQTRRPEMDKVVEAYNTVQAKEQVSYEEGDVARSSTDVVNRVATPEAKSRVQATQRPQDKAEINFQLTREEREVFVNALSGKEDPSEMSEREQTVLQKTAERIEKILDEARTFDTESRERLDKAVKEWYTRLSNGKHEAPADLLSLIRKASVNRFYPLVK